VKFCPWYPLADSHQHVPAGPGLLQLRVPPEDGLQRYPTGQSAMVHYELAGDLRAAAARLAAEHAGRGWLCRHTIEMSEADVAGIDGFHARLLRDFRARFGALPGEAA
jgi:hypothetical protein